MSLRKHLCAALAMLLITSCSSRDTKATYEASSPLCKQSTTTDDGPNPSALANEKPADENAVAGQVLEKVGRTIFWLEIKLLEPSKKTSTQCRMP